MSPWIRIGTSPSMGIGMSWIRMGIGMRIGMSPSMRIGMNWIRMGIGMGIGMSPRVRIGTSPWSRTGMSSRV